MGSPDFFRSECRQSSANSRCDNHNNLDTSSSRQSAALLEAVSSGNEQAARHILESNQISDLNYQGEKENGTALYWACHHGYLDLVEVLLALCSQWEVRTRWGATCLHACADNNQEAVARFLLQHTKIEVNAKTKNGDTPCHMAAYRGHLDLVRLLVEKGANVHLCNKRGLDIMREAEVGRHYHIIKYLAGVMQKKACRPPLIKQSSAPAASHFNFNAEDFIDLSAHKHPNSRTYLKQESLSTNSQLDFSFTLNKSNGAENVHRFVDHMVLSTPMVEGITENVNLDGHVMQVGPMRERGTRTSYMPERDNLGHAHGTQDYKMLKHLPTKPPPLHHANFRHPMHKHINQRSQSSMEFDQHQLALCKPAVNGMNMKLLEH